MKKKTANGFRPASEPTPVYHAYAPGTPVILGTTKHSGIHPGQKAMIVGRHPTEPGYAVEVENVQRVGLFGGASYTEPATIYLLPSEFILDATRLRQLAESTHSDQAAPVDEGQRGTIVDDSGGSIEGQS